MSQTIEQVVERKECLPHAEWEQAQKAYRFLVQLTEDAQGIWSAIALNLPGTGSSGPTRDIAIARFKEAAAGVVESYVQDGEPIPWEKIETSEIPVGAKWITVHA
jgi:predicted RNase H-like HicB family nuclease